AQPLRQSPPDQSLTIGGGTGWLGVAFQPLDWMLPGGPLMARILLMTAASMAALAVVACGDNMSANAELTSPPTETAADPAAAETAVREARDFVSAAGQASLVEIRTSEMALEKSTSA